MKARLASLLLPFLLGLPACAVDTTEAADAEEEVDEVGQELCGIPSRYDFDGYLSQNPGAKGVRFHFTPEPTYGVVIHEAFIARNEVELFQAPSPFGFPLKGLALGDDRGHDPNFDPRRTRAFIVVDFIQGEGWLITNASHFKLCQVLPFSPDPCSSLSSGSREVVNAWEAGREKNWIWADWVPNPYGVKLFRLRVSARISVPADELFFGLDVAEKLGCAIDQQLFVYADTAGYMRTIFEGDGFPSSATYFHCGGGPFVLDQRNEGSGDPDDNGNLCGDPAYTWNQPFSPWK